MESKKFNVFALFMMIVMSVFCIYVGMKDTKGKDGTDGKSSYELAVENGLFSGTELEYLQSLQGKDGSNVTIEDVYEAYLKENKLTSENCTLAQFINTYYPNTLLDEETELALSEFATAQALRSTVDIMYSCYMNSSIIYVSSNTLKSTGDEVYVLEDSDYVAIGLSAGSGVIYQVNEDTAYVITNYHVVYVSNYSNNDDYRVYYDEDTGEYFTATYDEAKIQTLTTSYGPFGTTTTNYVLKTDLKPAPTATHFAESYEVYLYGYQSEDYALTATFVGGSAENDIAVLKIDKSTSKNNERIFGEDYKAASIGNSSSLAVGETAIAVGNPLLADTSNVDTNSTTSVADYVNAYKESYIDALCLTATDGVVSNISEYQTFSSLIYGGNDAKMRLIRVSAAINAGNSGGGLYDIYGNLIGIVNGKIASSDYDNVGYAIPVNVATSIADKVIAECEGTSGNVNIKIVTASALGLTLSTTKDGNKSPYYDEETLSWVNSSSVVVSSVVATGKASVAGIKAGDLINSIQIGAKTYELNNDYDFNDILIKVLCPENSSSVTIKLNITTKDEQGNVSSKDVELTLTANDFSELI